MKATLVLQVVADSIGKNNDRFERSEKHNFELNGNYNEVTNQINKAVSSLKEEKQAANDNEYCNACVVGIIINASNPLDEFVINEQFDCE